MTLYSGPKVLYHILPLPKKENLLHRLFISDKSATMVLKADQERLKSLLKDTITLLCKNGLTFHSEFSIEAVIGITLDKDDILLVSINEQIKSEKDSLESTELSAKQDLNYSETVTSSDVYPNKDSTARKRKLHIKSDELSNPSDENYHSEPELSREPEQWKRHEAKQPKRESNGENIAENNNVQDVTFIKQEVDVELSKQTPNVSDSITSLVGSRLMPADDQERDALWEQALAFNNGKMFTSQDGSQLTVDDSQASELQHGDMDQQVTVLISFCRCKDVHFTYYICNFNILTLKYLSNYISNIVHVFDTTCLKLNH